MKTKRTLSILLSIILLFSFVTPALAAEIDPSAQVSPYISPDREKTKNYSYTVAEKLSNGQAGDTIITIDVTVTGMYSQVDSTAEITEAYISIGGPQSSNWHCIYEGDSVETLTAEFYDNGVRKFDIQFTIRTNGSFSSKTVYYSNAVIVI